MIFKSAKQESEKQQQQQQQQQQQESEKQEKDLYEKLSSLIDIGGIFTFMGVRCSVMYFGTRHADGGGKEIGIMASWLDT